MIRLLLALVVTLSACAAPTAPAASPAALTSCIRSYEDAGVVISACYIVCPKDMEAYANATGQSFSMVASCH